MKHLFILIFYFLRTFLILIKPGGIKTLMAENIMLRNQLIIASRHRKRAPNLSLWDRLCFAFLAAVVYPKRLAKIAIVINPLC